MLPDTGTIRKSFRDATLTLHLCGRVTAGNAGELAREGRRMLRGQPLARRVVVDCAGIEDLDDYGLTVLLAAERLAAEQGAAFDLANVPDPIADRLRLYHWEQVRRRHRPARTRERRQWLAAIGGAVLEHLADLAFMLEFLGGAATAVGRFLVRPRSLRWNDCILTMQRTGVEALPIVGLISFLLGLIMAFMSSVQLQQFGANIYVASLVGLAMTRELGPVMTAIVVAGRSGSAFAAEIGTMRINEEIDALTVMGFDPLSFLTTPKIVAALLVVPMLTLFSDLFAIAGGMLVGIGMLDLTVYGYINQTITTLDLFDVFWGVGKSAVFAVLIAWIGCLRGFQVRGGADAVGRATTSAVVTSIFAIVLTDSIFAVILRYWE